MLSYLRFLLSHVSLDGVLDLEPVFRLFSFVFSLSLLNSVGLLFPVPESRGWNDSGTGMFSRDGNSVSGSIETPFAKFSFTLDMLNVL